MSIVFIHGLGQDAASWDKTVSAISVQATAHRPDLTAMLAHQTPTYANLYRAFTAYCAAIPELLTLCGLSLGAVLALNYMADYPEKVDSAVLIAPQYKMPKALLRFQNLVLTVMPKSSFRKMGPEKNEIIKLTNSMADLDLSARLKSISRPTLILCGEKDRANKKAALTMAEQMPNARFQSVEGAGHEANIDAPGKLTAIINEFCHARIDPIA